MRDCDVIVSKPEPADSAAAKFAEDLACRLAELGREVVLVPDVYHLAPESAAVAKLRSLKKPLVVFSAHYPRAAFWSLRALGVEGNYSEDGAGVGRPVTCFRLEDKCCPDRWVEHLEKQFGPPAGDKKKLSRVEGTSEERWYPVVDYERCTNCGECIEFCLFGVYDRGENGAIRVSAPTACKPGCPACSRVCPVQAIMFPAYADDPAIAGSPEGTIQPFNPDEISAVSEHAAEVKAEEKKKS